MSSPPAESVTKILFRINNEFTLKVKVLLANKDRDRRRSRFASMWAYNTDKYANVSEVSAINLETSDYLIFETYMDYNTRINMNCQFKPKSIMFSYDNIHQFAWMLATAYDWLTNRTDVFQVDSTTNEITGLSPMCSNLTVMCESPHMKNYTDHILKFTPTIRIDRQSREKQKGVLLLMGQKNDQVGSLSADNIASLLYFLDHFDMATFCTATVNEVLLALPMLKPTNTKK